MILPCHTQDCPRTGVITLEYSTGKTFIRWGVLTETHDYCVECAEAKEAEVEKKNHLARRVRVIPIVGLPATEGVGSDCYPATVVEVSKSGKRVGVQRNGYNAAPGSDYFTNQKWIISETPCGEIHYYSLRQNGRWIAVGGNRNCGCSLSLGHRRAYQNPSF